LTLGDDDIAVSVEAARRSTAGLSIVGLVAATGSRASAFQGRRVLVGAIDPCGECEVCRRGGAAVCPSLRRRDAATRVDQHVVASARWATMLGDGLELPIPGAAVVAGDAAIAYTLYARTGLQPRDPAIVVGATPVARFLVEILLAKSITPTVIADPAHTAWVAWLGARKVDIARVATDASDDTMRAAAQEAIVARGLGAKPWRILASDPEVGPRAAALAGPRATLTLMGRPAALPGQLVADEVIVIGVAGAHPDLVVEVAALCMKGDLDLVGGTTTRATSDASCALVEELAS
jgi:6-hydroxycyclohex-1-ene-1-carbonyl-CoA dehydrogenase